MADINNIKEMFNSGRLSQLIATKTTILNQHHDNAEVLSILASAHSGLGQNDEALQLFFEAEKKAPDNFLINFNIGNIYLLQYKYREAKQYFEKSIKVKPSFSEALNNLGYCQQELNEFNDALENFKKAIEYNPKYLMAMHNIKTNYVKTNRLLEMIEFLISLHEEHRDNKDIRNFISSSLHVLNVSKLDKKVAPMISDFIRDESIDSKGLGRNSQMIIDNHINDIYDESFEKIIKDLLPKCDNQILQLIYAHLNNLPILSINFEILISKLRDGFFKEWKKNKNRFFINDIGKNFIKVIAYQMNLNDYLFSSSITKNELEELQEHIINTLNQDGNIDIEILYLFQSFEPVRKNNKLTKLIHNLLNNNNYFDSFYNEFIDDFVKSKNYINDIEKLKEIKDDVSVAVESFYEEDPYPRWKKLTLNTNKINFESTITNELTMSKFNPVKLAKYRTETVETLVAGCGTGRDALTFALNVNNTNVTAVDLSSASLSYAIMKSEQYGARNIHFMKGDLLDVDHLNKEFDYIISGGVLHHMKDPLEGLKTLSRNLKDGGYMTISLYSEFARTSVTNLREKIRKENLSFDKNDIRKFREDNRFNDDENFKLISQFSDYYNLNEVKDLLFHIQEHLFTPLSLKTLIDSSGLQFLGFRLRRQDTVDGYRLRYPNDFEGLNLDNWNEYEKIVDHNIFSGMYTFTCVKNKNG